MVRLLGAMFMGWNAYRKRRKSTLSMTVKWMILDVFTIVVLSKHSTLVIWAAAIPSLVRISQ